MAKPNNYVVKSVVKAQIAKGNVTVLPMSRTRSTGWSNGNIDQAVKRAKANGRKTVRAYDIVVM